jgi:hypothetical protein
MADHDWRGCVWCGATTRHDLTADHGWVCYRDVRAPRAESLAEYIAGDPANRGKQHEPSDPPYSPNSPLAIAMFGHPEVS